MINDDGGEPGEDENDNDGDDCNDDDDDGELVKKCLSPVRCSPSHQSASKKKKKIIKWPKV